MPSSPRLRLCRIICSSLVLSQSFTNRLWCEQNEKWCIKGRGRDQFGPEGPEVSTSAACRFPAVRDRAKGRRAAGDPNLKLEAPHGTDSSQTPRRSNQILTFGPASRDRALNRCIHLISRRRKRRPVIVPRREVHGFPVILDSAIGTKPRRGTKSLCPASSTAFRSPSLARRSHPIRHPRELVTLTPRSAA